MQPTLIPQVLHNLQATRLKDGSNLAHTLITIFLDATPPTLDALHAACVTNDAATTTRLVSRLCGSSGSIGAARFAELCAEFEHCPPTDRVSLRRHINALRDEYARLEGALADYVHPRYHLMYGT
jgi:HPt (histidine-containing phosphotransfer) domain-containing protein